VQPFSFSFGVVEAGFIRGTTTITYLFMAVAFDRFASF
jgi:hypothetical protein